MELIKRDNLYYLRHSFRKNRKPVYREKYVGKIIPENLVEIKESFLRKCYEEDLFKRFEAIRKEFSFEWKRLPESVKKKTILDIAIKFTYNTNAIEGSTITMEETEEVVKRKIAPNRPLSEIKETLNHVDVFLDAINEKKELSLSMINRWHKNLFSETKPDIAGKVRDYLVRVGDYRSPDWQDLDKLLKEMFNWYKKNRKIAHSVELAARMHYKFEKLHPYGDGNGRIGRLIIAYILRKAGYPLLIIEYKKRKQYYHALGKEEYDFMLYFFRRYISQNGEYLK